MPFIRTLHPRIPMRSLLTALLVGGSLLGPPAAVGQGQSTPPGDAAGPRTVAAAPRTLAARPGPWAPAPGPFAPAPGTAMRGEPRGTAHVALGGVAGGFVGLVGGMVVGRLVDGAGDEDCIEFCFGPRTVLGGLGGEALGMALGAHLANGRRGRLAASLLASAGLLTAGLFVASEKPSLALVVPLGQLAGTVATERAGARGAP